MLFDIITIFPGIFDSFLKESLIYKAQQKKLIKISLHNLRDWSSDSKHKKVDDKPCGGGNGMVMRADIIYKAVQDIQKTPKNKNLASQEPCLASSMATSSPQNKKSKIIIFSPRGKKLNQKMLYDFAKLDQLIMICGRYEGIDERVMKFAEPVSVGNYVLMGGELPAMVVTEGVSRLIPRVLGNEDLILKRTKKDSEIKGQKYLEYPQYTRPEEFKIFKDGKNKKLKVPKILLSGHHKDIQEWREKKSRKI